MTPAELHELRWIIARLVLRALLQAAVTAPIISRIVRLFGLITTLSGLRSSQVQWAESLAPEGLVLVPEWPKLREHLAAARRRRMLSLRDETTVDGDEVVLLVADKRNIPWSGNGIPIEPRCSVDPTLGQRALVLLGPESQGCCAGTPKGTTRA